MDELTTPEQVAELEPGSVIVNASGYAAVLQVIDGHRVFELAHADGRVDAEYVTRLATRWFLLHRPGQVPPVALDDGDWPRYDVHRDTVLVDIENVGPPVTLAVFVRSDVAHQVADQLNARDVAAMPAVKAWEQRFTDLQAEYGRQIVALERRLKVQADRIRELQGEAFRNGSGTGEGQA